ncbi:MAG: DEAD/DEAH box helicase, partial [Acidimicrobiales bacterium]
MPTTFAALGVPAPLIEVLSGAGYSSPFPIQAATLPSSLAGRDVLGRGRTGSGKTVAFAVPVVAAVAASAQRRRQGWPRALVLVPTRELAAQVAAALIPLARAMQLRVAVVHGGVSQGPQVSALRHGGDVLVACPGRLEDLINQGHCHLGGVEVCVLDEADHLADLGFLPAVRRLLDQVPAGGQRLLFSATLDGAIDALVRRYLTNPVTHSVDPVAAGPPDLAHYAFNVAQPDKAAVVRELASGAGRALLFTRTKHGARKLALDLSTQGIPAADLHGNLSQAQRDRNLAAFAGGGVRVLVATDIAARGIHVDDVALVVHVDPPTEPKAYLHRSGRTARAGAAGTVVTLVLADQARDVNTMFRQAGIQPVSARVGAGDGKAAALAGPPAALVLPAPA